MIWTTLAQLSSPAYLAAAALLGYVSFAVISKRQAKACEMQDWDLLSPEEQK